MDAVVGEIEAAVRVEHEVVWCAQRTAVAFGVEIGNGSGGDINALDAATVVPAWIERAGEQQVAEIDRRKASAVVAQVQRAVGSDGGTVGSAFDLGNGFFATIGVHAGDSRAEHFDEDDAAVRHRNRTFRKSQARSDLSHFQSSHVGTPLC